MDTDTLIASLPERLHATRQAGDYTFDSQVCHEYA